MDKFQTCYLARVIYEASWRSVSVILDWLQAQMPWRSGVLVVPFNSNSLSRLRRTVRATIVRLLLKLANKSIDLFHRCMMTLICGTKGKCLCPVCLVPLEELCDLSKTFPMRTISQAIEGYETWLRKKGQGEEILKALGLQPVNVGIFRPNSHSN